eukprot:scaffold37417_cov31-Tisochrysis_lutea.AAC.6
MRRRINKRVRSMLVWKTWTRRQGEGCGVQGEQARLCASKVDEFELERRRVDQEIIRLEVTVADPKPVHIFERLERLRGNIPRQDWHLAGEAGAAERWVAGEPGRGRPGRDRWGSAAAACGTPSPSSVSSRGGSPSPDEGTFPPARNVEARRVAAHC